MSEEDQQIIDSLSREVQLWMDNVASKKGYSSIAAACSYSSSTVPWWKNDAEAAIAWRDLVWITCFSIMESVQAGQRGIPTTEELIEELPQLVW